MHDALTPAAWLIGALPMLALLFFSVEAWLGIRRGRSVPVEATASDVCILIPAHNEEAIIEETLERFRPALSTSTRLLVVADNCTDDTAALVRQQGFEVLERFDSERRGKGFALAFGRDHLRAAPPQCIIVMDADCSSDPRSISSLAAYSLETRRACQAQYVFAPGPEASPMVQISNFAFWVKNVVRQRGAARAGGGAILAGTGMAFPWDLFNQLPLATGSIVEDLSLTLDLARSGNAPLFFEQAKVVSAAASERATLGQRSRWEHGFLAVAASRGIPLLGHGIAALDRKAILLGLHLLVPPLALLMIVSTIIAALLAAFAIVAGNWAPFAAMSLSMIVALLGVFANWSLEGHRWLKPRTLAMVPLYLVWKIPVYLRFVTGKRAQWIRTERE